jgi:hypothetical protein
MYFSIESRTREIRINLEPFINCTTGEGASTIRKGKHLNLSKWAEFYRQGGKVWIINLVGGTPYFED